MQACVAAVARKAKDVRRPCTCPPALLFQRRPSNGYRRAAVAHISQLSPPHSVPRPLAAGPPGMLRKGAPCGAPPPLLCRARVWCSCCCLHPRATPGVLARLGAPPTPVMHGPAAGASRAASCAAATTPNHAFPGQMVQRWPSTGRKTAAASRVSRLPLGSSGMGVPHHGELESDVAVCFRSRSHPALVPSCVAS